MAHRVGCNDLAIHNRQVLGVHAVMGYSRMNAAAKFLGVLRQQICLTCRLGDLLSSPGYFTV